MKEILGYIPLVIAFSVLLMSLGSFRAARRASQSAERLHSLLDGCGVPRVQKKIGIDGSVYVSVSHPPVDTRFFLVLWAASQAGVQPYDIPARITI